MEKTEQKKGGVSNFVDSMLKSAQESKEVKPQTRYDRVDEAQLEKTMMNLKKGVVRGR